MQWKDKFLSIVTSFVPITILYVRNACHLIRKKYTALRKYRKKKTADRKIKLRTLCQQIKYAIRAKHKLYLAKIEASLNENPKMFWKYH
jgi:hypothetical protein